MGCQQSTAATGPPKGVKGVGQTERMVSRAHRVEQKQLQQKGEPPNNSKANSSNTSVASTTIVGTGPKLNSIGQLMPEEVVRRTHSSILTESMRLGTEGSEIIVEVR
jgi:hypothetical protein